MPDGTKMKQQDLADAADVSLGTIQNLEDPTRTYTRRPQSLKYVERVFWEPGSVDAVLAGGDPTPRAEVPEQPEVPEPPVGTEESMTDLPLDIVDELDEGRLLGTTVLNLTQGGADARLIVVVRGEPDASPEQIRKNLLAWRRARRMLQAIDVEEVDEREEPPPAAGT